MKGFFVFSTLVFGHLAYAAPHSELIKATLEAQPACGNFVRYDDQNLYLGFGWYRNTLIEPRQPIPAKFRVAPFDGSAPFELSTKDAAIDLIAEGSSAYVLTYSSLEEWDLKRRERVAEHATYAIGRSLAYKEHAKAMARYKDKLIIAHGRLGVSIFNLKAKRLVNQVRLLTSQLPLESMATGVAIQGNLAYVVMDNFHVTRPDDGVVIFRGIVVVNMDSESVLSELGGMDPGADGLVSDSSRLIVSFGGMPLWKFNMAALHGLDLPGPAVRVWQYPIAGHPTGSPSMDGKYYYTCFLKPPSFPGENGGIYRKIPLALDRRVLMLD